MKHVTITGASDDLVEVDGDIIEEFDAYDKWVYLHFDTGTVVKIGYGLVQGKGWHIEAVKAGDCVLRYDPPETQDGRHYTDKLHVVGEFSSIACWSTEDGPSIEDLRVWFEGLDMMDFTKEELLAMYHAMQPKRG